MPRGEAKADLPERVCAKVDMPSGLLAFDLTQQVAKVVGIDK